MRVVDIVQGFLGSGKTTLIDHLIREVFPLERILVIQTEWGESELGNYGTRVTIRNYDWEKGFNLIKIRKTLYMPGANRIIFELNGMVPAEKLLQILGIMRTRGEITIGACITVFHGPTWEVMGKPLEEIFLLMTLASQGFWIRDGNKELTQWIRSIQPKGCLTAGNEWESWYKQIEQANKQSLLGKLATLGSVVSGIYLFYWLILKKI